MLRNMIDRVWAPLVCKYVLERKMFRTKLVEKAELNMIHPIYLPMNVAALEAIKDKKLWEELIAYFP
jgi:hypothetical protein